VPDLESAVSAKQTIEETGEAAFPCIRFQDAERGHYLYGDLYARGGPWDDWKIGDRQQ